MLSDRHIRKLAKKKGLVYPLNEEFLQPASYDVHLGPTFINVKTGERRIAVDAEGYFTLPPGELWLGATSECFSIPDDIAAQVEGRSSWGRLGLLTHITAGFIDPGFEGMITLELYNIGAYPLVLPIIFDLSVDNSKVEPIAQVSFTKLSSKARKSYRVRGHYIDPRGPEESKLEEYVEKP